MTGDEKPESRLSPYEDFSREEWAQLRQSTPMPLREAELRDLRGLGDVLSTDEVEQVYLPLRRLISLYLSATADVRQVTTAFLGREPVRVPYVIGIAGSVGVGKSTVARLLRALLARLPHRPTVDLITTDGFLLPNAELQRRGLMKRKGFPESYDLEALVRFLTRVRSGERWVSAPVYSHLTYDLVPGAVQTVDLPDILIVEGLNVLQHGARRRASAPTVLVSDFLDFTIYLDADQESIRRWYIERFLALVDTAFREPQSYFHRYATLSLAEATETAGRIWDEINQPNLEQNILPTRGRARLILQKDDGHLVHRIRLRRV
ncbi:type I pantothenate kinase [Micromonospora sp. CPCC 206060]|uniref:type I pantothenate kinase n=1 Tax=Micromonospora sp. CPCC 206060 TaxID=3122406 RepID=UPI002FEF097B